VEQVQSNAWVARHGLAHAARIFVDPSEVSLCMLPPRDKSRAEVRFFERQFANASKITGS
jgi:hypothetical protein